MKILTIIGARPQIIKAAGLSRAIRNGYGNAINEILVHTGQHYDRNMSDVFFEEMDIPAPHHNLNVGSASHGVQTARMVEGIERILEQEAPGCLVLYGDTNSTLAGAVAAAKMHVPVAHIEAGLRSFNKSMPEEINRIVCDHASTLLFSPTGTGVRNLEREGLRAGGGYPYTIDNPGIFHCGDIMYDNALHFSGIAEERSQVLSQHSLSKDGYLLCTVHRDYNTDNPNRLRSLFESLLMLAARYGEKVVLPLHPRTKKRIGELLEQPLAKEIFGSRNLLIIDPVPYLDMLLLEKNASMILTDSGGVQKEAYFFHRPVIILRTETEWTEIVEQGAGEVAGVSAEKIIAAYHRFKNNEKPAFPPIFGDGSAGNFICETLLRNFDNQQSAKR